MTQNSQPKVLCIDDEPDILSSLERTLRRRFQVLSADSPQKARELVQENDDLCAIICDYFLGETSGTHLLKELGSIQPLASRVLLSGQVDLKALEEAINSSVVHKFILKPWENDQLLLQILEAQRLYKVRLEKERLQKLSITDPITQLTNHRFFQERIRLEWEKHSRSTESLTLIMMDLDHFKKVNDRFGHPEGDQCLFEVAQILQSNSPQGSSLSRYGGEEFALILPNTDSAKALIVAERIREAVLKESFNNYPLSISLGVATAGEHAQSVDELIISADQSLLQAKRRGRNQTVVGLNFAP
jgi:diguanylate cyclase (GGDEF)-like protein